MKVYVAYNIVDASGISWGSTVTTIPRWTRETVKELLEALAAHARDNGHPGTEWHHITIVHHIELET